MVDKKQRLFAAAKKLFSEQGFKKTNIASIAREADMAVGSFYRYFQSKEDIFLAVYNAENERVKRELLGKLDLNEDPEQVLQTAVSQIFASTEGNRILQEWFTNPQINQLLAEKNAQAVEDSVMVATLNILVDKWLAEGKTKPEMDRPRILSLFSVLTVVDLHQSELVTTNYLQLLRDLITGILAVILK